MVGIMASAYKGLTEEEQERVFLLATGKDDFSDLDSNFCQGFAACHDEGLNPWWTSWGANQRDVYFYIKTDSNDDDSWEYYCRYSMDTNNAEFDDTIREMLAVTEPLVEDITVEDEEEASNATAILDQSLPEDSTTTNDSPVPVANAPVQSISENMNGSSSSNFVSMSLLVLAMPLLGWYILL